MFGALTEKLSSVFSGLSFKKKLTEDNISEAVREVRLALLEADVNYSVTKDFVKRVKEKALGDAVIKSVSPGQQFIKVIHDELIALMGEQESALDLSQSPAVILLCGLQGSGKTTFAAKLAKFLKKKEFHKKPLLVACDLQRPAAIDQLMVLGEQISVPVFSIKGSTDPKHIALLALEKARAENFDVIIVDTAGRLHVDEELMKELSTLKSALKPQEVLFVANAATGQEAVNIAAEFNRRIEITGSVLTMLDGNTRAGAAISIAHITEKPLKFEGTGEKLDDVQLFNPTSMADRILGMGDTINLVKMAQEHVNDDEAKKLEQKIRKATFTYNDYLSQMQTMKKMGSIKSLLKMLPGVGSMPELEMSDEKFAKIEAVILSMTLAERQEKVELIPSRRKRIAKGSGTEVEEVNKLVKSFKQAKQFFKNMPNMKQLEKMMGGMAWR
ncbi:MAG: signal recognition particle protein [Chlamydiales bacterium]|nr:signal recognition particle protein [Chlamydiales bacterium]